MFYLVSGLAATAAFIWFRYNHERSGRLHTALLLLFLWEAGRFLFLAVIWPDAELVLLAAVAAVQLISWGLLLWGVGVTLTLLGGGAILAVVFAFLLPETAVPLFQWCFITALPLTLKLWRATAVATPAVPLTEPTERPTLECIAEGVVVTNQDGLIDFVNESGARMLNSVPNHLRGQSATEVLSSLPIADQQSGQNQFELHGRMLQSEMNLIYDQAGSV